ncbi:acyltransferase [Nocardioides sp.]|uniref:acyltransferase family protein n=1 Tax=Nocardioides sp. TaxID=35761 RepID=UPI00272938A7|nr:acyltransferase [Nocardioides sp.]MDO9454980.1 acyltransferase [Nocardioides sp.]
MTKETHTAFSDYADVLRLVSMVGVVLIHTRVGSSGDELKFGDVALDQVAKACDGVFFFVSGYLWQRADGSRQPGRYLKRRFYALITPYLFWTVALAFILVMSKAKDSEQLPSPGHLLHQIFLETSFWFVPQLLAGLWVAGMLVNRNHHVVGGVALLTLTLLYGVNLYVGLLDIPHTGAPLGFAVFAFAGMQWCRHETKFRQRLLKHSAPGLTAIVIGCYLAAVAEARYLGTEDSLRITNSLYGFVFLALFMNVAYQRRLQWRETMRGSSYGVYLTHFPLLILLTSVLDQVLGKEETAYGFGPVQHFFARVGAALLVWMAAMCVIRIGHWVHAGRIVGAPSRRAQATGARGRHDESPEMAGSATARTSDRVV